MGNSPQAKITILESRSVISLCGADKYSFLQGIITNDIERVTDDHAIYAFLLTPQGRYVYDLFLAKHEERFLIDCQASRKDELLKHLTFRKLKSSIQIEDVSGSLCVTAVLADGPHDPFAQEIVAQGDARRYVDGVMFADPRTRAMGVRGMLSKTSISSLAKDRGLALADEALYRSRQISLGVPECATEMEVTKALPLEYCADLLNAIDWNKGCYTGQEVTARLKHQGLIKRRLALLAIEGAPPGPGDTISLNGSDVGNVKSFADGRALALVKVEALRQALAEGHTLSVGQAQGYVVRPVWAQEDYV